MDAEALANHEGYRKLCAMRDGAYEQVHEMSAEVRAKIANLEAGNRRDRRRAQGFRNQLELMESQLRGRIDAVFNRLLKGFDPSTGTTREVQDEAAAALEAIFV